MRTRRLHLGIGLGLLASAVACALWWAIRSTPGPDPVALVGGNAKASELARDADAHVVTAGSPEAVARGSASEDERAPVRSPPVDATSAMPLDAIAVAGRVVLPLGTPADESLAIVATGAHFEDGGRTRRSAVASDGSFRALFSKRTTRGSIALESRYLLCDERKIPRVRELDGELVLEPALGGRVHGRVSVPALRAGEAAGWDEIRVSAVHDPTNRRVACDGEGRFELGPLPAGAKLRLFVSSPHWLNANVEDVELRAGAIARVELALQRGVRVAGRVVGPSGEAFPGATVDTSLIGSRSDFGLPGESRIAELEADGDFEFEGLRPGRRRLAARADGCARTELVLDELRDGDARTGVVLTLGVGAALEVVVRWPDGRPAGGAAITLEQDRPTRDGGVMTERLGGNTDADGRFRFAGLAPNACELLARARPDAAGEGTHARRAAYWEARRKDAMPGGVPLELVLSGGASARGRAVDDRGEPIERFTVVAQRLDDAGIRLTTDLLQPFASEDGAFEMRGLAAGRWRLRAKASGHVESEPVELELPGEGAALELVLARCARFEGRVLDPEGEPVVGASVRRKFETKRARDSEASVVTSRAAGSFAVTRARPGRSWISASAEGFARSEWLALDLAPAGEVTELVLRLRPEARIEGVVRDASGEVAGRVVRIERADGRAELAQTDEHGVFARGGLEPGHYRVVLEPSGTEARLRAVSSARSDHAAEVELAPGGVAHVELPIDPPGAIPVSGRVTAGGRAIAGCGIAWKTSEWRDGALTDASGRFRVRLDRADRWQVELFVGEERVAIEHVVVPDARSFERDFELPTGAIAGTVRDEEGRAVSGVRVTTSGAPWRERRTDEFGRYAFEYLPAGEHGIVAGGFASTREGDRDLARSERTLALAAGERVDPFDLVLPRGGAIEGRVVDAAGRPAPSFVSARDRRSGRSAGNCGVGPDGRFRIGGLAPGEYELLTGAERALAATVTVRAGGTSTVEFVVRE